MDPEFCCFMPVDLIFLRKWAETITEILSFWTAN